MHYFKKRDGTKVAWTSGFDFYGSLAEDIGVDRGTAKTLFYMVIFRADLVRLGATAQGVGLGQVTPESSFSYELVGDYVEQIVKHYIIERYIEEISRQDQKVA